jgi:putative copper export protein
VHASTCALQCGDALFTWLGFLGQALWPGALVVELVVLAPGRRARETPRARLAWAAAPRLCWTVRGALTLTVGAFLGEIASLAVQVAGGDWAAALAPGTLRGLFSSQNGHLLLARLVLVLAVFLFASRLSAPAAAPLPLSSQGRARRTPQALGLVAPVPLMLRWEVGRVFLALGASAYLILVALSGHAANVAPGWLSYPIDWLHLVYTAAWVVGSRRWPSPSCFTTTR